MEVSQARGHWNSTTRSTRFFALPETLGCQNGKYDAIPGFCTQTKSAEDLMLWTIAQMAAAVGSKPGGALDPVARLAGVSIDSRTIRPGELFIAIHGPRHDGHDHVPAALERGAVAAVVAEGLVSRYPGWVADRCIQVADTFEALKQFAQAVREAWGGKIAGVTGSVGKTTTKEILAKLLGAKLRVLKSEGNFNNEYGLPLTLFGLDESHQAAVLEMGMSRPGELKRLGGGGGPGGGGGRGGV